ncbi:MAG: hypothetical protein PHS96_05275 [Anaerolineales bacterium]|nr:hypothetical protein [Anaerolineales bacterium]
MGVGDLVAVAVIVAVGVWVVVAVGDGINVVAAVAMEPGRTGVGVVTGSRPHEHKNPTRAKIEKNRLFIWPSFLVEQKKTRAPHYRGVSFLAGTIRVVRRILVSRDICYNDHRFYPILLIAA